MLHLMVGCKIFPQTPFSLFCTLGAVCVLEIIKCSFCLDSVICWEVDNTWYHIGCPLLHVIFYNYQLLIGWVMTSLLLDFITKSTSDVVMVICNCNPLQLFIVEFVSWNTTTIIVALQCQLHTITCDGSMQIFSQTPFCTSSQPVLWYKRCCKRKILTNLQPHLHVLTALNNTLTVNIRHFE